MDGSSPFPSWEARQLSTARGGPRVFLTDCGGNRMGGVESESAKQNKRPERTLSEAEVGVEGRAVATLRAPG